MNEAASDMHHGARCKVRGYSSRNIGSFASEWKIFEIISNSYVILKLNPFGLFHVAFDYLCDTTETCVTITSSCCTLPMGIVRALFFIPIVDPPTAQPAIRILRHRPSTHCHRQNHFFICIDCASSSIVW